jgi:hypothetical protein
MPWAVKIWALRLWVVTGSSVGLYWLAYTLGFGG